MKYTVVTLFIIFIFLECEAQQPATFQNLVNVGTISPEAASLGKFGNVPVSNFTGVPGITIPVYEINVGTIKLPISLNYHAGGIRVDETASCVGIGWALNCTGVVSRSMIGRPDKYSSTYNYIGSPDAQTVYNTPSKYTNFTYLWQVREHNNDSEPDIFQYSANGINGKFIFKNDGSILQIPVTNNQLSFDGVNFKIIDPQGNTYIFDERRQSYSSEVSSTSPYPFVSTWCLTKLIASNSVDTIRFSYESQVIVATDKMESFTHRLGENVHCSSQPSPGPPADGYQISNISHEEYYLKEIKWRGGKVVFNNASGRTDVASGLRLDGVDVYAYKNSVYTMVSKTKLYQSYFYSNLGTSDTSEKRYRLKLDSVATLDNFTSAQGATYRMSYNTTNPIPPRGSYAQDRWGFNNGHYENTTLMPKQTALYYYSYYTFGDANRNADESNAQAGTLTSIQYPTRGRTDFEYELHRYHTNLPQSQYNSLTSGLCCGTSSYSQQTFTPNSNSSGFRYKVFISKYNYSGVTDRPRIKVTDQANGQVIIQETNMTVDQDYSNSTYGNMPSVTMVSGHTYLIEINLYSTNPNVNASIELGWDEVTPGASDITKGGGLRTKSVANYDVYNRFLTKEIYQYGSDSTGTALTPQYYQNLNYEVGNYQDLSGGCVASAFNVWTYHANGVLPTTQCSGSPVVYGAVTKKQVDSNNNPLGKEVYTYTVFVDETSPPALPPMEWKLPSTALTYMVSNEWKSGKLLSTETYKSVASDFQMIKSVINTYTEGLSLSYPILKVFLNLIDLSSVSLPPPTADIAFIANSYFTLNLVPLKTGAMLLTSSIETTKDDNNNSKVESQYFTYGNTPLVPVKIEKASSKGETLIENIKYPLDLASPGNIYQKMVDRNMKEAVVQSQKLRNGTQLTWTSINYNDWFGNSKLLMPQSVTEQVGTNSPELKVQFNSYDAYGNILQQQKVDDIYQSYLWDYSNTYPIAVVANAANTSIAYTSFEAENNGNWSVPSSTRDAAQAATGSRSYIFTGTNGVSKSSGLTASQAYIVSYWKKGGVAGSFAVSGSTQTTTGETLNGWTYYEHKVTNVTTISITGSSGNIDELRLFPQGSQITTYTYDPLVGMTSSIDPNNVTACYQYDSFGRLKWVKDTRGNIVKAIDYHYKGN